MRRVEELGRIVGEKLEAALRSLVSWFSRHWDDIKDGFRTTAVIIRNTARAVEFLFNTFKLLQNSITRPMRIMLSVWEKFLAIVSGTARAFSWIPGIGGKLDSTAGKIDVLRENLRALNNTLAGTESAANRAGRALDGLDAHDRARGASAKSRVPKGMPGPKPITSGTFLQGGDAAKKKKGGVQDLLPIGLRLLEAQASITKDIRDDIRVQVQIVRWLEQRIRIERNKERLVELLDELASRRERLASLREKPEKDRTRMSTLFGGPFLSGDAFSTAASFGYTAKPRDLLRDLRMGNAQLAKFARALTTLKKRGAPKSFIEELRAGGLGSADYASQVAGAKPGVFRQIIRAVNYRDKVEQRIQHMDVKSNTVTVNANSVNVHGLRGDKGNDTHRRTSTRASRRRSGRI